MHINLPLTYYYFEPHSRQYMKKISSPGRKFTASKWPSDLRRERMLCKLAKRFSLPWYDEHYAPIDISVYTVEQEETWSLFKQYADTLASLSRAQGKSIRELRISMVNQHSNLHEAVKYFGLLMQNAKHQKSWDDTKEAYQ